MEVLNVVVVVVAVVVVNCRCCRCCRCCSWTISQPRLSASVVVFVVGGGGGAVAIVHDVSVPPNSLKLNGILAMAVRSCIGFAYATGVHTPTFYGSGSEVSAFVVKK